MLWRVQYHFQMEEYFGKICFSRQSFGQVNDRVYLTDSPVNASQSEISQSSDDESNSGPPPQKKPNRNAVNIWRASKDVFDK